MEEVGAWRLWPSILYLDGNVLIGQMIWRPDMRQLRMLRSSITGVALLGMLFTFTACGDDSKDPRASARDASEESGNGSKDAPDNSDDENAEDEEDAENPDDLNEDGEGEDDEEGSDDSGFYADAFNGNFSGAVIDMDGDAAIAGITEILGAPSEDMGWNEGCPLDGPETNERNVRWGSFTLMLLRDGSSGTGRVFGWTYSVDPETFEGDLDGPEEDLIALPPGVLFGDPIDQVGQTMDMEVVSMEMFDTKMVSTEGWSLMSSQVNDPAPFTTVAVPYLPTCE